MNEERAAHFEKHRTQTSFMMQPPPILPENQEVYDVGDGDDADHLVIVVNHNSQGHIAQSSQLSVLIFLC